jgi:hypothetical protein
LTKRQFPYVLKIVPTYLADNNNDMNDFLSGSRLKVARAKDHIMEVAIQSTSFFESKPHRIFSERDAQGTGFTVKLRLERPIPDKISVVVGDALSQLRSALDVLVCSAALNNGATNTKNIYFPFAKDAAEFELPATQRKIEKLSNGDRMVVGAFKPYKGGNDLLWSLNALCNIDKHNRLIAVGGMGGRINAMHLTGGQYFIPAPRRQPLDKDVVLIVGRSGNPPQGDINLSLDIAFREVELVAGQPIVALLNKYADLVEYIINCFDRPR